MKLFLIVICTCFCTISYAQENKDAGAVAFDTIYTKPEVFASYPGGDSAWKVYVKKNLKYPKKAWWEEVETEITVKVIVDKTGKITEAKHLTVAGAYGFEKEAIKVVMNSGKWIPAMHRGKPVACEGTLVIPFVLKK
jgi:protein TonB